MNKQIFTAVILSLGVITLSLGLNGCENKAPAKDEQAAQPEEKNKTLSEAELIAKGDYLVNVIGGCNDCHSPKSMNDAGMPYPNPDLLLSGHPAGMAIPAFDGKTAASWVLFNMHNTAAVGPWGVSYAANISSDATGIGNWTEEQFFKAMREGKFKGMEGSRPLMPPMPWQNYARLSDEDLRAIFLYLKSTRPVANVVPAYQPPVK